MDALQKKLTVNEIFFSIQGESYLSGLPCIFIRLTGCHQRCTYCDTEYAFYEGQKRTIGEILQAIKAYPSKNVLITGGEPLLQSHCTLLAEELLADGYRVAVETSGNLDIRKLPSRVVKIMDIKTPASGEMHRNNYQNVGFLDSQDEIKFVTVNLDDADWAIDRVKSQKWHEICHISLSPVDRSLLPDLAEKILQSGLPIRLQMQFHKLIWPERERGF